MSLARSSPLNGSNRDDVKLGRSQRARPGLAIVESRSGYDDDSERYNDDTR